MNYPRHEVSCDGYCIIQADDETYTGASAIVEMSNGFVYLSLPTMEQPLLVDLLEISSSSNGLVRVNNYLRKSYGGTPRNTFR
ncbi:MAG: hypothetical protein EOM11_10825 [Erysipelotrichia bacterium]|nr:hypothetical protein [Erysipelotrichia bacterium]